MKIVFNGKEEMASTNCGCRCLQSLNEGPIGSNTPSVQVNW